MYSSIQAKFDEAVAKHKLVFTPSTEKRGTFNDKVDVVYTTAASLAQKPQQPAPTPTPESKTEPEPAKPASPWLPPDEDLLVKREGNGYSVVLNKFAVAKYHFLLVTDEFKPQSSPLTEEDWAAIYELLRAVNKESGRRHVGFFNCGSASGASVAHKHVQFVPLPENFRPFPDTTKDVPLEGAAADDRVPFAHYIVGLAKDAPAEDIVFRYSEALGRVLTKISLANPGVQRPEITYNLVFTEEWILATPRRAAATESGLSVNALGTIGLFLAKSDEQRAEFEKRGLELFNSELGFPYEEVQVYAPDFQGYTHY